MQSILRMKQRRSISPASLNNVMRTARARFLGKLGMTFRVETRNQKPTLQRTLRNIIE